MRNLSSSRRVLLATTDRGCVPGWFRFRGDKKVLGETAARQGSGPRAVVWVLLASLTLAGLAFVIVALGWYPT